MEEVEQASLMLCMWHVTINLSRELQARTSDIDEEHKFMKDLWPIECMLIMMIHVMDGLPTNRPNQQAQFAEMSGFSLAHKLLAHTQSISRCEEDLRLNLDDLIGRLHAATVIPALWAEQRIRLFKDACNMARNFSTLTNGDAELRVRWRERSHVKDSLVRARSILYRLRTCSQVYRVQADHLLRDIIQPEEDEHWTDALYNDFMSVALMQPSLLHEAVVSILQ